MFGLRQRNRNESACLRAAARGTVHGEAVGEWYPESYHTTQLPLGPPGLAMDRATPTAVTAAPTAAAPILALDLGKYKSVACTYAGDPASARFESLTTDRAGLRQLFTRCGPAVVVIEACALAGWVHDLCVELGLNCKVANTASEAWKFKHSKRKTGSGGCANEWATRRIRIGGPAPRTETARCRSSNSRVRPEGVSDQGLRLRTGSREERHLFARTSLSRG